MKSRSKSGVLLLMISIVAIFCVVVVAFPPYRTYTVDGLVSSIVDADVITKFALNERPEISYTNGSCDLWRDVPAVIRFSGLERSEDQFFVIKKIKERMRDFDLPRVDVIFLTKKKSGVIPDSRELSHVVVRR
jgi:hypothetical protein